MVAVRGDHQQGIGAGVVVDAEHVLTCAHVVRGHDQAHLTVAFPHADNPFGDPLPVTGVQMPTDHRADVALLRVGAPMPAGVEPAPLRRPDSAALVGQRWWAYGFEDDYGHEAHGDVRAEAAYGWVELGTVSTREVTEGFSGAALWSPEYEAVVALVGQARTGGGRAFTLRMAATALPELDLVGLTEQWSIASAGADAVAHWGWTLARDEEGRRHWRPRARGVASDQQEGYRFRGRRVALTEIVDWLGSGPGASPLLVVTGSPGVGKSAVLARVVTTSDPAVAAELPADDDAVRAPLDAVSCAVHVKGKTALDVATEVARAASAPIPDVVEGFVDSLLAALADGPGTPFVVVVDALDEATSGQEARVVVDDLLVPLAERGAVHGVRVLVGSRKRDELGDLLGPLRAAGTTLDLDDDRYLERTDVVEYALATLALRGDASRRSVYRDEEVARPVAERIADVADGNFLVAGLVAHRHGRYDTTAVTPEQIRLPSTDDRVGQALRDYLDRVPDLPGVGAEQALAVLATAEAPGFSGELWRVAMKACTGAEVSADDLEAFATSSAANFLIETTGIETTGIETTGEERRYRLFHQALNDALAGDEPQRHLAVTQAFLELGARVGWDLAPSYLLRSLPHHALAAGRVDLLLADPTYLLHADLRRVVTASSDPAAGADTAQAQATVRLIRRTPGVVAAGPGERLAMLSVTEALAGAGVVFRDLPGPSRYRARWAETGVGGDELAILSGHRGEVSALCTVPVDGREHLVSVGEDGLLVIWDPRTDEAVRTIVADHFALYGVCVVRRGGKSVIAAGGGGGEITLWDPCSGDLVGGVVNPLHIVTSMCAVPRADGDDMLAAVGINGAAGIWELDAREPVQQWQVPEGSAHAVASVRGPGGPMLAIATRSAVRVHTLPGPDSVRLLAVDESYPDLSVLPGPDRDRLVIGSAPVRVVDPVDSEVLAVLDEICSTVGSVQVEGRWYVVLVKFGGQMTLWDPQDGAQTLVASGVPATTSNDLCGLRTGDRTAIASCDRDGLIRLWDLAGDTALGDPRSASYSLTGGVTVTTYGGRVVVARAGLDRRIRLIDPTDGGTVASVPTGLTPAVVRSVEVDGRWLLLLSATDGAVEVIDLESGAVVRTFAGTGRWTNNICVVRAPEPVLVLTTRDDTTVLRGKPLRDGGVGPVRATGLRSTISRVLRRGPSDAEPTDLLLRGQDVACSVSVDGHDLLAVTDGYHPIRLIVPASGEVVRSLPPFDRLVIGVHLLDWGDGHPLLATSHFEGPINVWDPLTGELVIGLDGHAASVTAVVAARGRHGARLIVTAGDDLAVMVWSVDRAAPLATIRLSSRPTGVAVMPERLLCIAFGPGVLAIECSFLADEQPIPGSEVRAR